MKKINYFLLLLMAVVVTFTSCSDDSEDDVNIVDDDLTVLQGDLESMTLTKENKYLLKGQVFVRSGKTLTINPGTIIFGDKATKGTLVVDRGGKIMAEGTKDEPIVITSVLPAGSRDRGDWGGLVILGNAPTNQNNPEIEGISPAVVFGGNDPADNSGVLRYVRVEFGGIELTPNNETNSITMGGVGSGTVMEYAQVSYGGDDGFEWFGGTNDGKYLISLGMWDDDFDIDFGYSGKNQFGLAVRYVSFADQSGSNGFECDNGPNDDSTSLLTQSLLSNFSIIGPRWLNNQSISGNYQHTIDLRRRVSLSLTNSVLCGFPRGIRMNQQSVGNNYAANRGILLNNILVAPTNTYVQGSGVTFDVKEYWEANNTTITDTDFPTVYGNLGLRKEMFYADLLNNQLPSNPNFAVTSGTLTTGAKFEDSRFADPFFDKVNFIGAFGSEDWTDTWAEFNPILKEY
jgi:hypothetical protein